MTHGTGFRRLSDVAYSFPPPRPVPELERLRLTTYEPLIVYDLRTIHRWNRRNIPH